MTLRPHPFYAPVAAASLAALVVSCAQSDDAPVSLEITGPHSLQVGDTASLTVETRSGTDHDHDWTSGDETLATVDGNGTVTALAEGEVIITATGRDTGATADHVIVISDEASTEDVPFYDRWLMSGHADSTSRAFNNWNDDGEIRASCARCHSREGFRDYLGDDGSEAWVVNQAAPIGSVVDCVTCHNDTATTLETVIFPSEVRLDGLGPEARCMTCHQGRASTDQVDANIEAAGVGDDEVSGDLSFSNIHYYPAGATLYAGQVRGGYQYADQVYDRRFRHVPDQNDCVSCHDPHSTRVDFERCETCHAGVTDGVTARDIRMIASLNVDYDGDGDTTEGIYFELEGLTEKLYTAVQRYASGVAGQPICYSPDANPNWFNSSNGAAQPCTEDEAVRENAFASWTPRLVRAAYNYQLAQKDRSAYVHNARYITKLLHDSIQDLNTQISEPVDMSAADRNAPGHFNGASRAARNWDDNEAVSASCSACHSGAPGYRFAVEFGVGIEVPETANGLECYTCHENFEDTYDTLEVTATTYPGGQTVEHGGFDNMCATCHSGRQSKATIDGAIASGNLGFKNVHYYPAAGVRNGSETSVGYEYEGKTYAGSLVHVSRTQCTGCHDPVASNHTFKIEDVWQNTCQHCHADNAGPREVRVNRTEDYDGDGNANEPLADELGGLNEQLLAAIRTASAEGGAPTICYGSAYPYWFVDNGGSTDGICAPEDQTYPNGYADWTPALMKAAHNYQFNAKDPGGYIHNFDYLAQLVIDSIEDLGGPIDGVIRP